MPNPVPPHQVISSFDSSWLAELIAPSSREIYAFDEGTLALLIASTAAHRALRRAAADAKRMSLLDILPGLSQKRLQRTMAALREGTMTEATLPATRRGHDSIDVPVRLRLSLVQLPGLTTLVAVVEDAPDAAHTPPPVHSDKRLAQIEAHVPGLLLQLRREPSGTLRFDFLSQACKDLLGSSADLLYDDPTRFLAQIVEEDRQDLARKMSRSATYLIGLNWEGRIWIESWQDFKWINLRAMPSDEGERGVLWTGLMTNITQSKRLAEENRKSREQLAELSAHIEDVRERERERIERDLHDDLGGNLSALKMMLVQFCKQLTLTPPLEERRQFLNQLIDRSIESIHRISADLRPGILDAGLVAAIEWLVQEQQRHNGIPYRLHSDWQDISLPANLATSLFRIAQEACNNIRKHAQATQVDIYLVGKDGELVLEVTDNGIGISEERRNNPRSFGLLGMSERIAALGGRFQLTTRSGHGTTVRVTTPLHLH